VPPCGPKSWQMPFRPQFWPTLATVTMLAVMLALGTWQLERLRWKRTLIERVEARIGAEPMAVPDEDAWAGLDRDQIDYRPVRATGRFRHEQEIHVYTHLSRPRGQFGGQGYWVITPLALANGATVLVNRGFVPQSFKTRGSRPHGLPAGEVTVAGLARIGETRGLFVPADTPAENTWFTRDIGAMARHLNLDRVAPFYIEAAASGPAGRLPQGGETRVSFANNHLQYAITWYGLALVLVAVYVLFHLAQARRR